MVLARCVQYRQIWRRTDRVITSEIFCRKQFPACRGCVVRCGTCSWDRTEANDFASVLLGRIAKHGVQRCGLLLPMFRGLCVSLLVTTMSCVKTAEPIEMPFAMWTRVDLRDHVGGLGYQERGNFGGTTPCDAAYRQNSWTKGHFSLISVADTFATCCSVT